MPFRKIIFIVVLIGLFLACTTQKVLTLTGSKTNFGSYYTYRIEHPPIPKDSSDTETAKFIYKIEQTVKIQMDSRGYEMTPLADLVIEYRLILENKVDYRVDDSYYYRNAYRYYSYPYYPYVQKKEYKRGILIVEIREDYGDALVWEGSLNLKYNKRSNKNKASPVENAFDMIFSEYPYTAGNPNPVQKPDLVN